MTRAATQISSSPVRQDQALSTSWTDNPAGMLRLADEWQALAERVGADVYMRPDWQEVWWDHFAAGRQLACLEARVDGELVGLVPFAIERIWLGPWPQRIARLSGTDPNCIIFQLSLDPDWAESVLRKAVTHLTQALRCVAVSFTPVSDLAAHLAPLRALAGPGSPVALVEEEAGTHTVFDLPNQFDTYLKLLPKKRRAQFRSQAKGLSEGFEMTSNSGVADLAAFDDFVAFHSRQWRAASQGGHFADWPGSADFYRDYVKRCALERRVWLYHLAGSNGPIATQFCLLSARTAHWRLPARTLDPGAQRLSSGTVGLVKMIETLINQGINRIEAGRGKYSYKLYYGGRMVPLHRLILHSERLGAAARVKLLLNWADLVNFLYYRVWFVKLSHRVQKITGRRPRPLWRSWIKTRL